MKNRPINIYLQFGVLATVLLMTGTATAEVRYTITDLGTLGGSTSTGTGINVSGQVTGATDTKLSSSDRRAHTFITNSSGQMIDLTPASVLSTGRGINASGQVVGVYNLEAFVTGTDGQITYLGLLHGTYGTSEGNAINDAGQVVGTSYDQMNPNADHFRAFVYNPNGQKTDLGTLGGHNSFGYGINNAGQITGGAQTSGGSSHAFITNLNGQMFDLGVLPGGIASIGRGLNDSGQVTGGAIAANGKSHAFVTDSHGQMIDLGTVRNGYHAIGIDINASGQVVGFDSVDTPLTTASLSTTSTLGKVAFVTDNGVIKNLNALKTGANAKNWIITVAYAINDAGQITGAGYNNNGNIFSSGVQHAILLTPVETSPISASPKNYGNPNPDCPKAVCGNPIDTATGNKFQAETDFIGPANTGLEIRRFYNSQSNAKTTLGFGWRGSWQQALTIDSANNTVKAIREDGRVESFTKSATGDWLSDADVVNQLSVIKDAANQPIGWQLLTRDDAVESYTLDGRLNSITTRSGMATSLSYDNQNRLSKVRGHFGYALSFAYNTSNQLSSISLPDGSSYQYAYDANNNLVSVTHPDQTKRQYVYENSTFTHLLTGIVDENGKRFASWTYDTKGRATSSQHAGGAELTSVAYNADGTATVTDALGHQHSYNFTTQFDVVKPTNVTGTANKGLGAKAFSYDANGFVASQTDFNGNVTTFVRDAAGLETSRTEAAGTALARTISTSWHSNFRLPTQIIEPNRVTTLSYDNNGNLTERTVTAGTDSRAWAYTHNSVGQVLSVDGPRTDVNDITHYAYDAKGGLQSITDALGHVTQITAYDANGLPLSVKDANGLVSKLAYDARGRLLSKQVGNEVTQYTYDAVGQVTKTIAPDGSVIAFSYDAAHRLLKITDQSGNHIDYTLDANGNRLKQSVYDPKAKLTQTLSNTFDNLNRLATMVGAEGQTAAYFYDDNDNPVALTDPLNNKTAWSYDALNRLANSVDADGLSTQTTYDANDNLLSVTDPLTHKTQYNYDGLGNQLTLTSPDTGTSQSSFDSAGNKISSIDARGKQGDFNYDALNRAKTLRYGDQSISFFYDQGVNGVGHLTQMGDNSGGTRWTYDSHGRVASKTFSAGPLSLVTRYAYDGNGRLTAMTYPSGKVVQLTYTNGLVTALDANGKILVSDIHYQPFGLPADWLFGNGIKTTREFNLNGRMIAYDLGDRSRQLIVDAAGQITGYQDTDMNHDQNFTYDALSRLIGFSTPISQIDYSYDANGNRTNKTAGGNTETFTLDTQSNRLLGISKNAVSAKTYRYDDAGNVISDGVNSFTYDDSGRLIKASGGFGAEQYLVNGLGQRVGKVKGSTVDRSGDANQDGTLNATDLRLIVLMTQGSAQVNLAADCNHDNKITAVDATCTQTKMADMRVNPGKYVQTGTYFAYDEAGHLIGEYNQQGTPIQETVWLGDMPVAVMADAKNYFVYADHLNAPRVIADELGKVVWRWDSEAFGTTLANEDPDKNGKAFSYNLRFPGQYFDQSTGLHYNGFRDYDPTIGRYIQSDPIGLNGGLNTYGYVGGNPISLIDKLGLAIDSVDLCTDSVQGHWWIKTDSKEVGMQGGAFVLDPRVSWRSHAGRKGNCSKISNVNSACVDRKTNGDLGWFIKDGVCQGAVRDVIGECMIERDVNHQNPLKYKGVYGFYLEFMENSPFAY